MWQVRELKQQLAGYHRAVTFDLSSMREMAELKRGRAQQDLDALRAELEEAQKAASSAVGRAKTDAQKHPEELAQDIVRRQRALQDSVVWEFNELRQSADQTSARITEVGTVGKVDSRVSKTTGRARQDHRRAQAGQRRHGHAGLIATNGAGVAAVRELGERNDYELQLDKSPLPPIQLQFLAECQTPSARRNKA